MDEILYYSFKYNAILKCSTSKEAGKVCLPLG